MREALSAQELAALDVAGVPRTVQGVAKRAGAEAWPRRRRAALGGGWEYPVATLPRAVRDAVLARVAGDAGVPVPVAGGALAVDARPLAEWQRRCEGARLAILMEIDRLAGLAGGLERAIAALIRGAEAGTLAPGLAALVPVANARSGKNGARTLSRRSIFNWRAARAAGDSLAPREAARGAAIPAWAPVLMAAWRVPQKRPLAAVVEALPGLLPPGVACPSYAQARRFLSQVSTVERERGRLGPVGLLKVKSYVKRTVDDLEPLDVITADGHTFDAEVAHPIHGRPFRPELTAVLDIKTRRVVGWSAALAEATWGTVDALRHAARVGIPAMLYTDRGAGFINETVQRILAQLGTTQTVSLPYRSQSRGAMERAHQSIWIRAARALPSYVGRDMDRQARKAAEKIQAKHLKIAGTAPTLMAWPEFLTWCQATVDAYNARPHRGLGKIRDAVTGKVRHQSPDEVWAAAELAGWEPMRVREDELAVLLRPYEIRTTRRGLVSLFGNSYHLRELEHHHGDQVQVGYDIHDAGRVWVADAAGRPLGVATLDGHARPYMPATAIEAARAQRLRRRLETIEARADEIRAEAGPGVLEYQPPVEIPEIEAAEADRLFAALDPVPEVVPVVAPVAGVRPAFSDEIAWAEWVLAAGPLVEDADRALLRRRMQSTSFRMLLGLDDETEQDSAAG